MVVDTVRGLRHDEVGPRHQVHVVQGAERARIGAEDSLLGSGRLVAEAELVGLHDAQHGGVREPRGVSHEDFLETRGDADEGAAVSVLIRVLTQLLQSHLIERWTLVLRNSRDDVEQVPHGVKHGEGPWSQRMLLPLIAGTVSIHYPLHLR